MGTLVGKTPILITCFHNNHLFSIIQTKLIQQKISKSKVCPTKFVWSGGYSRCQCRVLGSTTVKFVLALSINTVAIYNYNQVCRITTVYVHEITIIISYVRTRIAICLHVLCTFPMFIYTTEQD